LRQVDALQNACELARREIIVLRDELRDTQLSSLSANSGVAVQGSVALQSALKNETRLREKIEFLENEVAQQVKIVTQESIEASRQTAEVRKLQKLIAETNTKISQLEDENRRLIQGSERLSEEIRESKSNSRLADQQFHGLKNTIRSLQEENDILQRDNKDLEARLLSEKGKLINEMNGLNNIIEGYRRYSDIQKSSYSSVGPGQSSFIHLNSSTVEKLTHPSTVNISTNLPKSAKKVVATHTNEGNYLICDRTGKKRLAVAGDDSVKIWDVRSSSLVRTFKCSLGHSIARCDLSAYTVIGAGSDKTCRVWNLKTDRMVRFSR
jgi:hypothetical protein